MPITTFDLGKKCCATNTDPNAFQLVDPAIAAAFSIMTALIEALINGLDADAIIGSLGLPSYRVSTDILIELFRSLLNSIPEVPLPDPANLIDIIKSTILPSLTATSLPKAPSPLHPPIFPIVIPLDPILKPLIKTGIALLIEAILKLLARADKALKDSAKDPNGTANGGFDTGLLNQIFSEACGDQGMTVSLQLTQSTNNGNTTTSTQVTVTLPSGKKLKLPKLPAFPVDIMMYFQLLTGPDIIQLFKSLFETLFDQFIEPVAKIADTVAAIAQAVDTFSYEVLEASIPQLSLMKLLLMKIDAEIPKGLKIKVVSPEIQALIDLAIVPALTLAEPVLAPTAWIGALALCAAASPATAYSTVSIARLVHPIMNQDDLPPWERLTHKNPLFAIFLDEIAWRSSIYSTGSLIWQTKAPAVLPYVPPTLFPIIHIPPHLT
jgi:hypothetical protein